MTIVASVKVRDGLIVGTDSMTEISVPTEQGPQLLKTYSNARKLFQIARAPIAVATYGLGNIGNRSIEGLVLDFSRSQGANGSTIREVSERLHASVRGHYDTAFGQTPAEQMPVLGFMIAGYSPGQPFPEEYEFVLPRDIAPAEVRPADAFGASWRGVDMPFTRLYHGFDPYTLPPRLAEQGLSEEQIGAVLNPEGLETVVIYHGMPVQDAINFAAYILNTTIGWATFALGVPSCGPPLQIATILPDKGFAWVAQPELKVHA